VAGKHITITQDQKGQGYITIDGKITRTRHPLQVINGEFLIPVDTLEAIDSSLGLFQTRLLNQNPTPTASPSPTPETIVPSEQPEPGAVPELQIQDLQPTEAGPALPPASPEALAPGGASQPFQVTIPDGVREIASADLVTLLKRAPLPSVASVAVAPGGASPQAHGSYAPTVQTVCENVGRLLKSDLEATGKFTVHLPNQPVTPKTLSKIVEWANSSASDALIELTVNVSPFRNLTGMRIWTAHEAGDGAARPAEKGGGYGLPTAFNYLPYEEYSLLLASMIYGGLNKVGAFRTRPVEIAPSYLLRRVAMPAVAISLGYASNDKERERISRADFAAEAANAIAGALIQMQQLNMESVYGG
ncbi:MAG: N-acetylmuramoyl-L-alanine amidase, partial [Candidatus Sumerlaeota bacterium]|nr:N-acetylmuramoyl-L-alanine amidase [Candidatus Sumerlaeota bacterium]